MWATWLWWICSRVDVGVVWLKGELVKNQMKLRKVKDDMS